MAIESPLIYAVYLSQVLLISLYWPSRLSRRVRRLVELFPPSEYPKLYTGPAPLAKIDRNLRVYRYLNTALLLLGLGALAAAWLSHYPLAAFGPPRRAYALYSMLQFSPLLVAAFRGLAYYRRMRAAARGRKIRTAQLEVRRLFDFVPPALFAAAVAIYVAATALLLYLPEGRGWRLDGGFTGWVSLHRPIVFMTIVNMWGAGVFVRAYLRKKDPHQTHEDRARQIRLVAQIWLVATIILSVLVAGNKILWAFRLYEYIVPLASLYFQAVATSLFWLILRFNPFLRLQPESFEGYKADPPQPVL